MAAKKAMPFMPKGKPSPAKDIADGMAKKKGSGPQPFPPFKKKAGK